MTLSEKKILDEMAKHPDKVTITPLDSSHGYTMRDLVTGKAVTVPGVTERIQKGLHSGKGIEPKDAAGRLAVEIATTKGTRAHKEVQEWITYGFKPTSKEAISLVDRINSMYPASQGWELKSEVPVADFKGFASSIDVLAVNKKTNQSSIIDLKTGSRHDANYTAQVTMYRKMLQSTYGIKANTANIIYSSTGKRAFSSIYEIGGKSKHGWMKDKDLSEIMYGSGLMHKKVDSQDIIDIKRAQLSASHASQFFKPYTPGQGKWSGPLNVLDIETDGAGKPVAVGVIKLRRNNRTGNLHLEDTFERYYYPSSIAGAKWQEAVNVHGLTPGVISKLRREQALKYGNKFNSTEQLDLLNFLKEGRVITQNGTDFDLPKLFGEFGDKLSQYNISSTDILIAGEHKFGKGHASLEKMSQQLFGKSMSEMGLSHHNAMDDIIHTALIYDAILQAGGTEGEAMKWLESHQGFNLGPYEDVVKSMVVQGKYNNFSLGDYVDMSKVRVHGKNGGDDTAPISEIARLARGYDDDGNNTGFGYEDIAPNLDEVNKDISDRQLLEESVMSTWSSQFARLNGTLDTVANVTRDWASAAEVSARASSRRAAISAMKGFKKESSEWYDQRKDVMEAYGVTEAGWGKVAAGVSAQEREEKWKERNALLSEAKELRRKHLMSQKEFESFEKAVSDSTKSNDDLADSLDKVTGRAKAFNHALNQLWGERLYDPQGYADTVSGQLSGISKAWAGNLPSWLRGPFASTASGYIAKIQGKVAMQSYGVGMANKIGTTAGSTMMAAGTAAGNPYVVAAGAVVWGVTSLVSQAIGKYKEAKAKQVGERIQEAGYGVSTWWSLMTAPFQAIAKAIKLLAAGVLGLIGIAKGIIKSGFGTLSNFGNPVTNLTGVGFGNYQKSHIWDYFSGTSKGSFFNGVSSSANSVQQLYSVGRYDESRLIAAVMLGVYDELYTPGRSGEEMYEATVNKLLQLLKDTPSEQGRARIMSLSGSLDPSLPSLLDSLYYSGYNNLGEVKKGTGVWDFGFKDSERPGLERARASYGHAMEVWESVKVRAAVSLWNLAGRNIMNYVNAFGNAIATGDWKGAAKLLRSAVNELWKGIKTIVFGDSNKSFSDVIKETGEKIWEAIKPIMPQIFAIATEVAVGITKAFWGLIKSIWGVVGPFVAYLTTARFSSIEEIKKGKPLIQFGAEGSADTGWKATINESRVKERREGGYVTAYQMKISGLPEGWRYDRTDPLTGFSYYKNYKTGEEREVSGMPLEENGMGVYTWADLKAEAHKGLLWQLDNGQYFPIDTPDAVDRLKGLLSLYNTAKKYGWSDFQIEGVTEFLTGVPGKFKEVDPVGPYLDVIKNQAEFSVRQMSHEFQVQLLMKVEQDGKTTTTTIPVAPGNMVAIPIEISQDKDGIIGVKTSRAQTETRR